MKYNFASRTETIKASAIREILKLTADKNIISFAAGSPAKEALKTDIITEITAEILKNDPFLALSYNITEGYLPLRKKLLNIMDTRYKQYFSDNDLIITSGAQQAIELTAKALINKGDTVICENPSFLGSLNSFKTFEPNLVGIPVERDGICIEKLEKALENNKNVKFIYLIPNFQNPTGITMSEEKRKKVYELACKYNTLILEDNPYGDLRFAGEHIPNIKAFDTEGRVIYCGSFSKILSPGLRVGYLYAHNDIVEKIIVLKQVSDVHTTILSQLICDKFLEKYNFDEHINTLCDIYGKKAKLMLDEIEKNFDIEHTMSQGGLFIWATLKDDVNMLDFCKKAVLNKVAVVPGSAFLINENEKCNSFRMNYSTSSDQEIIKGIKILGDLLRG